MRANKNMGHRDRTGRGTANALASPPVYTAGQRKTRRMGLRILAGIITPPPAQRFAPAHPRRFRGRFPARRPVDPGARTPTSIGFPAFRPEPALNSKCSLAASRKGAISPWSSFDTTHPGTSPPNSISCTPPVQHGRGRTPRDLWGLSGLVTPTGSFLPPSRWPHSLATAAIR